jgi:hypothetical protein
MARIAHRFGRLSLDVVVQLTGRDSNVFSIVGYIAQALREHGHADAATEFATATTSCGSYDEVPRPAMRTVTVVTADALHVQRAHADYLVLQRGAHYLITLITVKGTSDPIHLGQY